jgi:hypothetical protein
MIDDRDKLTFRGVELEPDAWERLTRAIGVIGKATPKHRVKKGRKRSPAKRRATGGARAKG